jgi:hypothetical protein
MGLDLKEIVEKTKFSAQTLIVLEKTGWTSLPRGPFQGFSPCDQQGVSLRQESSARLEETLAEQTSRSRTQSVAVQGQVDKVHAARRIRCGADRDASWRSQ